MITATRMLDVTIASPFIPGVNLKGQVSGANWMFLRPSIPARHVLCLGVPPPSTLATLGRFSEKVTVVAAGRGLRPGAALRRTVPTSNVRLCEWRRGAPLPVDDAAVDVLSIAGYRGTWRLRWDRRLQRELRRVLRSDAVVYSEHLGAVDSLLDGDGPLAGTRREGSVAQRFCLTPRHGELHTAIPDSDSTMGAYFRRQALYGSTSAGERVRRVVNDAGRQLRRRLAWSRNHGSGRPARPDAPAPGLAHVHRAESNSWREQVRHLFADARPRIDHLVGRHGLLMGPRSAGLTTDPPEYLRSIAAAAGVRLDHFRWALSAKGEYSSRKLLFVLSDPTAPPDGPPTYVAKMVRDPAFNGRLENEHRALSLLSARRLVAPDTVPASVFFGHHAGLAILGESVVAGVPFLQRSRLTPDCPYFQAALEWFTALGAATPETRAAAPGEAAVILGALFTRFVELYKPTPTEREFLRVQVERLGAGPDPLPLTFQHGDPGVWNMLAIANQRVALLDWEAAETEGMPLWDLFYFVRTYAVAVGRAAGTRNSLSGVREQLLASTPLSRLAGEAVRRYCRHARLSAGLVEPLFYTCWMHRALKEATRLPADKLERGRYVALLRLAIAAQRAPGLNDLLGR